MDNSAIKVDKDKNLTSWKHFETLLKISLIIGIIIISGFIIYYVLTPEPGYVTFGILNENQEAENYPTQAPFNETIFFYLTVENNLEKVFNFSIKIKKGTKYTVLSSSVESNGTLQYEINDSLRIKENLLTEKLNISFSQTGAYQIIIAELWEITQSTTEVFFNILWLRLNITS